MSNTKKSVYAGALNQPIVFAFNGLSLVGPKEAIDQIVSEQRSAKLNKLLTHYDIRSKGATRWRELAFSLALDHVPGMSVITRYRKGKGRPPKLVSCDEKFISVIEEIDRERGKGINDAIKIAVKRKLLDGKVLSLERRYYEQKKLQRIQNKNGALPVFAKLESLPGFEKLATAAKKKPTRREQERRKRVLRFRETGVGPGYGRRTFKKGT